MDALSFAYWINGFLELSNAKTLNEAQVKLVREHLALVFTKVTGVTYTVPTVFTAQPGNPDQGPGIIVTAPTVTTETDDGSGRAKPGVGIFGCGPIPGTVYC